MVQSSQPLIEKYLEFLQLHSKKVKIIISFTAHSSGLLRSNYFI